jgi:integral membrane protein (TIGR01906 family)
MGREENKLPTTINTLIKLLIQGLIPILLILGNVRLILFTANAWVPIEYRLPGFPDDPYGFTIDDRLKWSAVDVDYLLNEDEIEYFDGYRLDSGEPMHNERELSHMQDVKILVEKTWMAFRVGFVVLLLLTILVGWDAGYEAVWESLRRGSIWTLILLAIIIVGILLAFGFLFVGFHRIFFEGETWLFYYSDTFIRLYPERFWRDVFMYLAGLTALQSAVLYWLSRKLIKRGTDPS